MAAAENSHDMLARYAAHGRHKEAKALLALVSPFTRENGAKWTALHFAAYFGHFRVLRVFLRFMHGNGRPTEQIDVRDHYGNTALHLAADAGHVRASRLLLDAGARIDVRDAAGETPVVVAAAQGRAEVVQLLLPRCKHREGPEVLLAAFVKSECFTTAGLVMRLRPDAVRSRAHMTKALLMFCNGRRVADPLRMVRLLCELGADFDARDEMQRTPLHLAAQRSWYDVVSFLLVDCKTSAVNKADRDMKTPLILACRWARGQARRQIIRLLLRYGADSNANYAVGKEAPLYRIGHRKDVRAVRMLVDAGARVDNDMVAMFSGVISAALHGNKKLLRWYSKHGYDFSASSPARIYVPFDRAAYAGNLGAMKTLVRLGGDPAFIDRLGYSALHSFVMGLEEPARCFVTDGASCEEIVAYLVDKCKIDPNLVANECGTALHIAAQIGMAETTKHLLRRGALVSVDRHSGMSSLVLASPGFPYFSTQRCSCSPSDFLLVIVNLYSYRMPDGRTPLVVAAVEGHTEVCKQLIGAGARIDHRPRGKNSDALACAASHHHRDIISLLIEHGAIPRCEDIRQALYAPNDATETVDLLLKHGASANFVSGHRRQSLLHVAAGFGQVGSIRLLLERGTVITLRDNKGWTALHHAAMYSDPSTMKALIENGADVHARDNAGMTCLHFAAHTMSVRNVRCLLDHHADINARDNAKRSPLMLACAWDEKFVQYLSDPGGNDTLSVVGELLISGARVNAKTERGLTALHIAVLCGRRDVASALIYAGAIVDARTRDCRTPLYHAAMAGHPDIIHTLVSRGARADTTDRSGRSALHVAAARGHARTVRALLALGVRDLGRDRRGRSSLDAAARAGHLGTVTELLAHDAARAGTEIAARAELIRSAVAAARRHKREDVARLLRVHEVSMAREAGGTHKSSCLVRNPMSANRPGARRDTQDADRSADELLGGRREWIARLSTSRYH